MYIYIYIYIYIYVYTILILLINIVPGRNENFFKQYLVILLVTITFSLANSELTYTPLGVFRAFAPI